MDNQFLRAHFHEKREIDGTKCCMVCNYYHQGTCRRFDLPVPNSDKINVCDEYVDSEPLNNLIALYKEPVKKKIASYSQMNDSELEALIQTDEHAMYEYAKRQEGRGNVDMAVSCYEAAGDMGIIYAYYCGGVLAEESGDISGAAHLYKKGHKEGEEWSTYRLGCMYYYDDIFAFFPKAKAEACFHYAAMKGISNAQAKYADILLAKFSDDPIGRGPDSGNFWLACALLNNDSEAQKINQRRRIGFTPSVLRGYDNMMDEIKESILVSYKQLLNDNQ